MDFPPSPHDRSGGLLDWLEDLWQAVRAVRPLRSEDIELHESEAGTQLLLAEAPSRAVAAALARCPLRVEVRTPPGASEPALWVAWGTINGRIPAKMGTDGMAVAGDKPQKKGFVYARAKFDHAKWIVAEVNVIASETELLPTASTGYELLASYEVAATGIKVSGERCGSVVIDPCTLPFE